MHFVQNRYWCTTPRASELINDGHVGNWTKTSQRGDVVRGVDASVSLAVSTMYCTKPGSYKYHDNGIVHTDDEAGATADRGVNKTTCNKVCMCSCLAMSREQAVSQASVLEGCRSEGRNDAALSLQRSCSTQSQEVVSNIDCVARRGASDVAGKPQNLPACVSSTQALTNRFPACFNSVSCFATRGQTSPKLEGPWGSRCVAQRNASASEPWPGLNVKEGLCRCNTKGSYDSLPHLRGLENPSGSSKHRCRHSA